MPIVHSPNYLLARCPTARPTDERIEQLWQAQNKHLLMLEFMPNVAFIARRLLALRGLQWSKDLRDDLIADGASEVVRSVRNSSVEALRVAVACGAVFGWPSEDV